MRAKLKGIIITLIAILCLMSLNVFVVNAEEDSKITVVKSDDEVSFDITLDGEDTEKGKVYVALYKGDVLAGIQTYNAVKNKTVEFTDIDKYNNAKIMWWDEQNKPVCEACVVQGGSENAGKDFAYAYVINAQYQKDSWGYLCVKVQILDESDNIYEKYLASNTTLYNFDEDYGAILEDLGESAEDRVSIDFTKLGLEDRNAVSALADALINNMIIYSVNDDGYIRSITMPSKNDDAKFTYSGALNGKFNADYMELGDAIIGESTYVFLVDAPEYAGSELADNERCGVRVGYELENEMTYDYVAFDMDENDVAGAVVVLNTGIEEEEDVSPEETYAYAYVLKAQYEKDSWGKAGIRVQILDESDNIYEAYLAKQTTLYNFDDNYSEILIALGASVEDRVSIDFTTYSENDRDGIKTLASALINNMIVYSANDDGEIMSITMPSSDADAKFTWNGVASGEFNEYYMELGDVIIGEDTYVFLIDAPEYAGSDLADEENCFVQKDFVLDDNTIYDYVAFDIDENDVAGAIVVLGFDAGTAYKSTNIAVINKVEPDTEGVNDVYKVSYYMDGELATATTDANLDSSALENAKCGDIYKFSIANGVIYGAEELLTFTDRTADGQNYAYAKDVNNTPCVKGAARLETSVAIKSEDNQGLYMGAVVEKKTSGKYVLALAQDGDGALAFDINELYNLSQDDAFVYVYDPEFKDDNVLSVGSLNDITVDYKLFNGEYEIEDEDGNAVDCPAFGMADYVFVRQYNGEIEDIVIYKNYEFDYDVTRS